MKLLLLGFSSIGRRRVLPAARAAGFGAIEIASHSASTDHLAGLGVENAFPSYEAALDQSRADLVYVSTVNSLHGALAERALEAGFHVVVDKPATLSLSETRRLSELAHAKQSCLAEATVWQYHPRVQAAQELFNSAGSAAEHIVSAFSFPPMPETDFRYDASLGGGVIWDLGPYAMSPSRVFFGTAPQTTSAFRTAFRCGVETAFSVLSIFPGGRTQVGSFGFTSGYINRMDIFGPNLALSMDRVFSPPANLETELAISDSAGRRTLKFAPADTFELFLKAVIKAIEDGDCSSFTSDLLHDAETMDRLRKAAFQSHEPIA